jgi:long-chain fatty acid transport protein
MLPAAAVGGTRLSVGLAAMAGFVRYQRDRRGVYQTEDSLQLTADLDDAYVDAAKTGLADPVSAAIAAPSGSVFVAIPLSNDIALGGGLYVPYAAPLTFPEDGAQKYALQEAFIAITRVHAAVGWQPSDKVAVGAGLAYVGGTASLVKMQDYAGLDLFADGMGRPPINQDTDFGEDAPSEVRELEVLSRQVQIRNAMTHGITFNAGVTMFPSDTVTLAASYDFGSRVNFKGPFSLDMNDAFWTSDLESSGVVFDPLVEGEATISFRTPMRARLGVGVETGAATFDVMLAWVRWSSVDAFSISMFSPQLEQPSLGFTDTTEVDLRRDWNDAVHVQVLPSFAVGEMKTLVTQVGYQSPATPDATIDVASPDGHRFLVGAGLGLGLGKADLLVDARLQAIAPRTVTASLSDLGNGTYSMLIGALGATLEVPL